MDIYTRKTWWKIALLITAIVIVGVSLFYSNYIVKQISQQERDKVELWAKAVQERVRLVQYTSELFDKLKVEERKKVELVAQGFRNLASDDPGIDISFFFRVIENNETVPVILTDETGKVISSRNINPALSSDKLFLAEEAKRMANKYPPITIVISNSKKNYLYYDDSNILKELIKVMDEIIESFISEVVVNSASVPVIFTKSNQIDILSYGNVDKDKALSEVLEDMKKDNQVIEVELNNETCFIFYQESFLLTQLKYYPLVQLSVIAAFLLISYVLFSTARKAEQNRVWVGMSKETAHQLGTPISSLMAWVSLLEAQYPEDTSIDELKKDVDRLETIADRFSKIGSAPVLLPTNMNEFLNEHVEYLRKRVSKKVCFEINQENTELEIDASKALMGWVLENLIRNAVDAMEGEGKLTLSVIEDGAKVYLDVEDTGKGIPKSRFKSIFQPGFTTKKRGWGLGLALVKRIVEEYHNGNISVVSSEPNASTVFRIIIKKS